MLTRKQYDNFEKSLTQSSRINYHSFKVQYFVEDLLRPDLKKQVIKFNKNQIRDLQDLLSTAGLKNAAIRELNVIKIPCVYSGKTLICIKSVYLDN